MSKSVQEIENNSVIDQDVVMPADLEQQIMKAKQQNQYLNKLMDELLEQGVDYDTHPGIPKPFLHQEGAQQLARVFKFSTEFEKTDYKVDLNTEPEFVKYEYRCKLYSRQNEAYVGDGVGSANTYEKKYRYKKNGEPQEDLAGQQNTIQKMAKKRAFVDAVLNVTGANRIFTQDRDVVQQYDEGSSNPAEADSPGEVVIGFGKYEGTKLSEIKQKDENYLQWVAENANSSQMRKAAKKVLQSNNSQNDSGQDDNSEKKQQLVNEICEDGNKYTIQDKMEEITNGEVSDINNIGDLSMDQLKTLRTLTVEIVEENKDIADQAAEVID